MFSAEGLNLLLDVRPFNTQTPKIAQKDVSGFLTFSAVVTN